VNKWLILREQKRGNLSERYSKGRFWSDPFSDRFELKSLIEEEDIQLPVYIDYRDEFRLHTRITNERENPILIRLDNDSGASR